MSGLLQMGWSVWNRAAAAAVFAVLLFGSPAVAQSPSAPAPSQTALADTSSSPPPLASAIDEHYTLGAGDKVKVTVYGEEDLSGEFLVDGMGQVQLPLVGQVKAAGLTIHDFVAEIAEVLQDGYLKAPKVSVQVLNYRPFYIIGEVNKPGEYPFENGLTVLRAVALAGGYTYRANDSSVYVRRVNAPEEILMPADSSTKIFPGDIVRVRERIF